VFDRDFLLALLAAVAIERIRFRVSFQSSATTAVALSPTGFFALITKFSCLNVDRLRRMRDLSFNLVHLLGKSPRIPSNCCALPKSY
jgi:hypothetical protein